MRIGGPRIFLLCACLLQATFVGAFVLSHHRQQVSQELFAQKKRREITIKDLIEKVERNPTKFTSSATKSSKNKRTRKRKANPQQTYVYASQKRTQINDEGPLRSNVKSEFDPLVQARQLGLVNAAAQHVDAVVGGREPEILGQVRVGKTNDSSSKAYIIYKPAGWSILGSGGKKNGKQEKDEKPVAVETSSSDTTDAPATAETGSKETTDDPLAAHLLDDYEQEDLLAVMTPKELAEYQQEIREEQEVRDEQVKKKKGSRVKRVKVKEDDGTVDVLEYDENDILAAMTPEEIQEFRAEDGFDLDITSSTTERKIQARTSTGKRASFASPLRPSVIAWLKDLKQSEGTPIRGGKYWIAVAGATNVDDTGLVLVCPKNKVDNLFVDSANYVAVVGNGKYLAPKSKTKEPDVPKDLLELNVVARLRKGRLEDTVVAVGVTILECPSTCTSVVQPCQRQFLDGIRGDPTANPLERRASRRLIHCRSLSVSSLVHDDDTTTIETESLPDDIAILADRRNHHEFVQGSFLGRQELRENSLTNAYREVNGAADGFPGWTVDRYDKWLVVQHDDKHYKGPLPSIHDGNTAGVYYLPSNRNRSAMGSSREVRPTLMEGQPAPNVVPILENGVVYHATLDRDLSTGIFLDQRPQRAWLTKNCNDDTRVLNCFAHCGAFSVAAATAGASTVSLDLERKWLDRIEPQMIANGIAFDDKHDCIYGDCFDWLARLSKRGEKYDIVILDPPSSSVGKTKKRWSVKRDMASLVELVAPLVKNGGLLWTTTNSATIHPVKFAKMCQKGLENAGAKKAKLERVVPMPVDFPSIGGPPPVKNLVWRL